MAGSGMVAVARDGLRRGENERERGIELGLKK